MTVLGSAMILAAVKAGVVKQTRVKKDGELKARPYQKTKGWPRLKRGQSSYKLVEVN